MADGPTTREEAALLEGMAFAAEAERLREALADARDAFADLFRQHTRALWTMKGEATYPVQERRATASRATAALKAIDAALALNQSRVPFADPPTGGVS